MNYQNLVLGTLSNDAFVQVNKKLAKKVGFIEAGLLAELTATFRMVKDGVKGYSFYKNGSEGQWFYLTQPTVEKRLGILRREHDSAIKKLVKENLIFKKQKGLPAKSHYLINWEKIAELLSEEESENSSENSSEVPEKSSEPLIQSDCTKRTSLSEQNVHPRVDETYSLDVTKCTSIITTNKNKEIKTNNTSSSSSQDKDFIDSLLKEKHPDKPFEQIKEELINDPTATIQTLKQYHSMLEYRLNTYKPKQVKKQTKRKDPVRTELIPDFMDENYKAPKEDIDQEQKKREIEEMLQKLRS